ncbi:MAG TPA: DNA polymerase IV [Clostridiales bacterium]|nr:DNA polymerase IV [Clostridiales bacterium]HBE12682.1 DNA polymerase IV [Clostridiales bacterium]
MERVILHSDLNNFYASVECLHNPSLQNRPVVVAGNPAFRHGIVLAKNEWAKKYGVSTGEPLWSARQKCPDIVCIEPRHPVYKEYSRMAKELYGEYTDRVEPYGPDECWLDVTGCIRLFGDGKCIADEIRARMKKEIGLSVSVGVSFNKVFAKLGSDMKKPDGTTVITKEEYPCIIWPLSVDKLLYVGNASKEKLKRYGLYTVGDIATASPEVLGGILGKNGITLWKFANGLDTSPVSVYGEKNLIQSVGNSTTTVRDLVTDEDVKTVLLVLCQMVSARLRSYGLLCKTVQLSMRDKNLLCYQRQDKLIRPNRTVHALFETGFSLYQKHHIAGIPLRSIGVRACDLVDGEYEQLSLLEEVATLQKKETLDAVADKIRTKFGKHALLLGRVLAGGGWGKLNLEDMTDIPGGHCLGG